MKKSLQVVQSVMGGGKTYEAIRFLSARRYFEGDCCIISVPTKELAKEIQEKLKKQTEPDVESEFDFSVEYQQEEKPLNLDIQAITSDTVENVYKSFSKAIKNPLVDVLIVTHEALFSLQRYDHYFLAKWHVVIDEDPRPLRFFSVQDFKNESTTLRRLSSKVHVSGEAVELAISSSDQHDIKQYLDERYSSVLSESTKQFLNFLGRDNDNLILVNKSKDKTSWFGIEYFPLDGIINRSRSTSILCSELSSHTKIYLDRHSIHVCDALFKARHAVYPRMLQSKITVLRLWDEGDNSISRMESFGIPKIKEIIEKRMHGDEYILRSNKRHSSIFSNAQGCKDVLPMVVNGVNTYSDYSCIVDLACYNQPIDEKLFYTCIDEKLSLPVGTFEAGVVESKNLELSAQAVARIGFRRIDSGEHESYLVIVPDKRTEDYLKERYLPYSTYKGALLKGAKLKKAGRVKGSMNAETQENVLKVDQLRRQGDSLNKACRAVGIGKATYNKYQ